MSGPYRSMLFVPGQQPSWVPKALRARPDAIILDLEDAVAESAKAGARESVAASIREYANNEEGADIWVRPNGLDSPNVGFDLDAAIQPGLTGLVLPKLSSRDDVIHYDALTTHFEHKNGVPAGTIEFVASLETAQGMARCEEIASAPRVVCLIGATARDADTGRALKFRWSIEGLEDFSISGAASCWPPGPLGTSTSSAGCGRTSTTSTVCGRSPTSSATWDTTARR